MARERGTTYSGEGMVKEVKNKAEAVFKHDLATHIPMLE
jgi:hypothetical protein